MKSPFPGMDPYIEGCGFWEGFHHGLIEKIADALSENLPENYIAETGERAYIVFVEPEGKKAHPFPEEFKESFVEIYELHPERRLVTCIEVLSPTNKRKDTPGWDLYQRKRKALFLGEATLVEIDLLRGGTRMPMLDDWPKSPYYLLVTRRDSPGDCRVWHAHFQHPLPPIPVPLLSSDPPVTLELQPLIDMFYARRHYDRRIDYSKPLQPPLSAEETTWFQAQLQARAATTTPT